MTGSSGTEKASAIIARLGSCVELVARDPNFRDISVGLYLNGDTITFWTFSSLEGARQRIEQIRDRALKLAGLEAVPGTHDQARFQCGNAHRKALRFMASEAVERKPDRAVPSGEIAVNDTKTRLRLIATPFEASGRWNYRVSAEGVAPAPQPTMRVKATVGGFMRYGDCQRVAEDVFTFPCGARHDELARLLITYARNVSAVDEMLAAQDLSGQMTTQTLGFAQT